MNINGKNEVNYFGQNRNSFGNAINCYIWDLTKNLIMRKAWLFIALAIPFLWVACEQDTLNQSIPKDQPLDENWKKGDSVPIVSNFYFQGKIDSQMYTIQYAINNYGVLFDSIKYGLCDTSNNFMGFNTTLGSAMNNSLTLKFLSCIPDSADSITNRSSIYLGAYPFGSHDLTNFREGVKVEWVDEQGTTWSSRPGTGASSNFRFQILDMAPDTTSLGDIYVTGVMDLRLYNGTQSIPVERGEFRLPLNGF
ncbi:hypothetical protein [Salibacter halophilus]|uniref:Uncharacterized protein n=1 Tax=Salibacter halophilus TaxID=1803916 RepID=A0A6N6M9L1_9FLAO|nr:hypothetical protein [Salibacter halophilus]KAB1065199.1 hypothetical protein F3059_04390 [Salibacter halophilus]